MDIMDQCIPTSVLPSKWNFPWLNSDIIRSIRHRNRAFKRAKKSGKLEHTEDYKKKQNKVTNLLKSAKLNFFVNLDPSNPKAFWKVTKFLTKQPTTIPILHDEGGNIIRNDAEKAKLLNDFFTKCFNSVTVAKKIRL